jgi:hypothetical protein
LAPSSYCPLRTWHTGCVTCRADAPFLDLVSALASHLTPSGAPHPDPERIMLWLDFFALDLHAPQVGSVALGGWQLLQP